MPVQKKTKITAPKKTTNRRRTNNGLGKPSIIIENKDCIEGIKEVKTGSVQLILTDPPYFLGMTHNGKKGKFNDLVICKPFYDILFEQYKRVLKPNGAILFFCDWRSYPFYYQIINNYFDVTNCLVWDKGAGPGNKYGSFHEFIIFCTLNKEFNKGGSNVLHIPGFTNPTQRAKEKQVFDSQKPQELLQTLILAHTKEKDLVLDTFVGSGSVGLACEALNRNFIGFELDARNFEVIKSRFNGEHPKITIK